MWVDVAFRITTQNFRIDGLRDSGFRPIGDAGAVHEGCEQACLRRRYTWLFANERQCSCMHNQQKYIQLK